jgi:predicted RNase H-like nuclease (RuvC/YqgF family)
MAQQQNPKQECNCDKKVKALEKQIADLGKKVETLEKQLTTFRKVLTK